MEAAELLDRCDFPGDAPLPLGVSGGPDSVAMALLADAAGLEIVIWHVHHGLREEADDDATLVADLAASLGAPFEVRHVDIAAGSGLEARAREARYAALPDDVCVGHTADDRAETVLLNLLRGAGLAGVAAPLDRVSRPIVALRRAETVALCRSAGVATVDDAMNHDPSFSRVALRSRVIPAASDALGRDVVPVINRHADLVADAHIAIRAAASSLDPTDVKALAAVPRAVATEALRGWIMAETNSTAAVDAASIDRLMAVVDGTHKATEIEGGSRVSRTAGRLRIS